MKFEVWFKCKTGVGGPFDQGRKDVGLGYLDWARAYAGVPKLHHHRVSGSVPGIARSPRIEISEEMARRSGHFQDRHSITVSMPRKSLNVFISVRPEAETDEETGEIHKICWACFSDDQAVLSAWEQAGFPLEWDAEQTT